MNEILLIQRSFEMKRNAFFVLSLVLISCSAAVLLPGCQDAANDKDVTVTFKLGYSGAANVPPPVTIKAGGTLGAEYPPDPQRDEYNFDGWYNGSKRYMSDTVIKKNITLTAKWQSQFPNVLERRIATNPLLKGDFPDPSVVLVNDAYYMVSTTMYFAPVAPIMKSYDLINWRIVSYATDMVADTPAYRLETETADRIGDYNRGQWASSIRYFDGKFWVLFMSLTTGRSYICHTTDPEKEPWQKITLDRSFYDASLFRDEANNRTFIFYGRGPISVTEMENDLTRVKSGGLNRQIIAQGDVAGGQDAEGAHAYYRNGYYYVFLITWGTSAVHKRQVLCYRTANIDTGTFEGKVVMLKHLGSRPGGVAQGHILQNIDGDYYGLFFQDRDAVGRVPVLVPMRWDNDDWPVFGDENGEIPVEFRIKQSPPLSYEQNIYVSDEFDDQTLPLAWQWNHNPDNANWSLSERHGYLRLKTATTARTIFHARNTLTQRTFEPACEGIIRMEPVNMNVGDIAGFAGLNATAGFIGIEQETDGKYIVMYTGDNEDSTAKGRNAAQTQRFKTAFAGTEVFLKINFVFKGPNNNVRETMSYAYSLDGVNWTNVYEPININYTLSHFTGYRFGLFNFSTQTTGGYVDFDYFHVK